MPDSIELHAQPRTVLGKKVGRLRRAGLVPANIYGHHVDSKAIQVDAIEVRRTVRAAGGNSLVRLLVEGEAGPRTVVIRRVQRQFTTGNYLHVDFQQVSLSEKMRAQIRVVLTGAAPVVDEEGAVVVQVLDSVEVECLPGDLPNHLEADLGSLTSTTSSLHVSDLTIPANVTVLTPVDQVIASATAATVEEEVEAPEAAEEQPEAAAEEETPAEAPPSEG